MEVLAWYELSQSQFQPIPLEKAYELVSPYGMFNLFVYGGSTAASVSSFFEQQIY
jgi:hypothetical protein